ncbi:MAG: protein translocase subunit SecF, partial [Clostridia bacterium]
GDTYIIDFRYKNIDKDDVAIDKRNTEIKNGIDTEVYPEISNIDKNFITYQSIGSTAANDLLSKAGIAVAVSTLLILIYIMFRFTMVSGIAAILALLHDVVILFALTVICRVQINTSFIAAIITIIAYSINNTIIIFDRCRENVKPFKGQKNIDYNGIGDESVRANMTRSIYTTLTTMVTIIFLAILGSDSIREFCVPILLGLCAGVFSSVFLATPMWSTMSIGFDHMKEKYAAKRGVSYDYKKKDEEVDLTAPIREKKKDDEDDNEFFASSSRVKTVGAKPDREKGKPIHKYNKKNTTFKKK